MSVEKMQKYPQQDDASHQAGAEQHGTAARTDPVAGLRAASGSGARELGDRGKSVP